MRFVAANLHPDHDTITTFWNGNISAIEAPFLHMLELASRWDGCGSTRSPIDGTKIDANASKYRSIQYDRAKDLGEKLAIDIATLMERAERADADRGVSPGVTG
ncbi:hypothetical protein GLI01_28270 [Gluconacetobacter liquefaciens]|uniref:Uncharacterized protein n=1 Tax=Gluconacetobacter liquefaciens TaxID=89584 RepID=A0A370FUY9_GLULI|nr:hypothetical protein C7453_11554 [Gluconacetobacter liquefaciens]GBQ95383.1 hypothetical protein AA0522_0585 [Gluconacetobacter liquefaciens NRIC 0522]GEB38792.1 hypothetical protein GLI01_28270 [Gluconacetobacter liquefaciens]